MGGLTITLMKTSTGPKVTVDRRLYLNAAKTKVVEEGDPEAKFLFAAVGREVLRADLKRLGCQIVTKADKAKAAKAAKVEKAEAKKAADVKAEADAATEKAEADAATAKAEEEAAKKAEAPATKPKEVGNQTNG